MDNRKEQKEQEESECIRLTENISVRLQDIETDLKGMKTDLKDMKESMNEGMNKLLERLVKYQGEKE